MSGSTSNHERGLREDSGSNTEHTANGPSATSERKRDEEFWLEDGNIVLVARNVEFRVYKGILVNHSPVFKDMFSLPPPVSDPPPTSQATAQTGSDCPVVHLSDSPEDIRHVLRVCVPTASLSFSPFSKLKPPFDMVSAVIRMAHKYQMQEMLTQAVQYLKQYFPDNLDDWAAGSHSGVRPPFAALHAIGAVNLARLVDEPSLLPTALLACCSLDSAILIGFPRGDGSYEQLARDDIARCLDARRHLTEWMLDMSVRIFDPHPSEDCRDTATCKAQLQQMLMGLGMYEEFFAHPNIFYSFSFPFEGSHMLMCCEFCQDMVRGRDRDERRRVWKLLPSIMRVEVENWGN